MRVRIQLFAVAGAVLWTLANPVHIVAADKAPAADVEILKQMLAASAAWNAHDKTAFDEPPRQQLLALAAKIGDPQLRDKTGQLLPDLEKAALHAAAIRQLQADLKSINPRQATTIEPGGPAWLRELVSDEPMQIFAQLASVSTDDGRGPHDKDYKLEDRVTDEWLARLAPFAELKHLSLANSNVKGPGLKVVGTLVNLESLNLTSIPLTDSALEPLGGLVKLKVLGLASTKVTGECCRHLARLTKLENLNCHYTPVNDAGLAEIATLTSLTRLEIVHTHFTDAGARSLSKLINLERLQLGSREATAAALESLRPLSKLRELDVHDMTPTPAGWQTIGELGSLEALRVYSGPVDDASLESLTKLHQLSKLILASPSITDDGLLKLAACDKLERLEIAGSKVSDAAIKQLQAKLPKLEVVR